MKQKIVLIDGYPVAVDEDSKNWAIHWFKPGAFTIKGRFQGHDFSSSVFREGNKYNVNINGTSYVVEPVPEDYFEEQDRNNTDESKVLSPMTGVIRDILVRPGEQIQRGQLLVRIESMKLVLTVNSANSGIIKEIKVQAGQKVSAGDLILEISI
jgi:biotin carboxyl carrier protein